MKDKTAQPGEATGVLDVRDPGEEVQSNPLRMVRPEDDEARSEESSHHLVTVVLGQRKDCVTDTEQSVTDTEQSVTDTEQSVTDTEQSVTDTEQSVTNTEQSVTNTEQSVTDTEQSVTDTEQSVTDTEQSVTNTEQSVTNTEQSVTDTEHSVTNTEQSVTNIKQSVTNTEQSVTDTAQSVTQPDTAGERAVQSSSQEADPKSLLDDRNSTENVFCDSFSVSQAGVVSCESPKPPCLKVGQTPLFIERNPENQMSASCRQDSDLSGTDRDENVDDDHEDALRSSTSPAVHFDTSTTPVTEAG